MNYFSAAVSYTLAEQFSGVMKLRGLQSAAKMGRAEGKYLFNYDCESS